MTIITEPELLIGKVLVALLLVSFIVLNLFRCYEQYWSAEWDKKECIPDGADAWKAPE